MVEIMTESLYGTKHPSYQDMVPDWMLCRDCYKGERAVKSKGVQYLPATYSMIQDGYGSNNPKSRGNIEYRNYRKRAVFEGHMEDAVDRAMGNLWFQPGKIELPAVMEPLREVATRKGESLEMLWRKVNTEQLITGRLGLLADMPQGKTVTKAARPYISMYIAEDIINWDEGETNEVVRDTLNLVVLNESGPRRKSVFDWEEINAFRVLVLGNDATNEEEMDAGAIYRMGFFEREESYDESKLIDMTFRGNRLNHIPFVFINSRDIVVEPEEPPLLGLANRDMTIYRTQADYRQGLFMQGHNTLVVTGEQEPEPGKEVRTGPGAIMYLPNPQADAKYIGISGEGLSEFREAIQNDNRASEVKAGSLTDTRSNEKESGDAMRTRIAGQTASLTTIALSGAFGLQAVLRSIAVWMGADPNQVIVTPNLVFGLPTMTPKDLVDLQTFKNQGGPIKDESIHQQVKRAHLTEDDYETDMAAIEQETPRVDLGGGLDEGTSEDDDDNSQ